MRQGTAVRVSCEAEENRNDNQANLTSPLAALSVWPCEQQREVDRGRNFSTFGRVFLVRCRPQSWASRYLQLLVEAGGSSGDNWCF